MSFFEYWKPYSYIQVFESKYGFIPNLSILDLLFNEGPNSINFL
ncbi:WbqC family protein [Chryseobacterium sp.]